MYLLDLIIFDELMNGFDLMGCEEFSNVLWVFVCDGMSVLILSYILYDFEVLCSDFILLCWGWILNVVN